MTKSEMIKTIVERMYGDSAEAEVRQCTQFCDMLEDVVTEALVDGDKVAWKGFLSAEVVSKDEHRGYNPQIGEIVTYPASKSVKVKLSKNIKDKVNGK